VENGRFVGQAAIAAIVSEFDTIIHPGVTGGFGNEPNPGIDNDPKVYLLLLAVRDGFTPPFSTTYIAGYFDPASEYALSAQNSASNQKEIIVMNINPLVGIDPTSIDFYAILAHEFQHMVHWEQKTHRLGVSDDSWLDEAMGQVARTFCGYGPDYGSVFDYQSDLDQNLNHSLTNFDESLGNYGMLYLWAQYVRDQFGNDIFNQMLHNSATGIASVNAALAAAGSAKDFTAVYRDWAVANFFGNGSTVAAPQAAWKYTSIDTWPGFHAYNNGENGVFLPGFFPPSRQNLSPLPALEPFSVGYSSYTPVQGGTGTVTWTRNGATAAASFVDGDPAGAVVTYDVQSGVQNPFTTIGYLIDENPSTSPHPGGNTVTRTAMASYAATKTPAGAPALPPTPRDVLEAMQASPTSRRYVEQTGKFHPVHVDAAIKEREKALRAQGIRPPF
jgi:hypothetical protein